MSLRESGRAWVTSSGGRYEAVPTSTPVAVICGDSVWRARPKSATFTWPRVEIMTFSGLMSRWTIPASWAAARAEAMGSR